MIFAFDDDQLAMRAAIRDMLDRECTPAQVRSAAEALRSVTVTAGDGGADADPGERWMRLAEMGVLGALIDPDRGGAGLDEVDFVGLLEEMGFAALPEPVVESALLAAPLLAALRPLADDSATAGIDQQLEALAEGELRMTVGGIELAAAGIVSSSVGAEGDSPTAVRTERVIGAGDAGALLLARRPDGSDWEVHSVPREQVDIAATPSVDPARDLSTISWTAGPETLLASGPQAAEALEDLVDRATLAAAAQLNGLANRMIEMAVIYAGDRKQFGRPIGSFQAVKHHLASARIRLEFSRPATYRAADSVAKRLPSRSHDVSMAKALAANAATLAARTSLQVHGAIGYTWESDLHFWMKRTWALVAAGGDERIHRRRALALAIESKGQQS
jgi:alkylation response protein AidB-like acyl-CoA dehydrogenase